jgi:hypothetical protein
MGAIRDDVADYDRNGVNYKKRGEINADIMPYRKSLADVAAEEEPRRSGCSGNVASDG